MVSSSKTRSDTSSSTKDNRIALTGEAVGINANEAAGDVSVHIVPDEAFELVSENSAGVFGLIGDLSQDLVGVVKANNQNTATAMQRSLEATTRANRSEFSQLAEQMVMIGIPVVALAWILGGKK